MDTSGIEPDTSRMLSERDKPTTPCALKFNASLYIYHKCKVHMRCFFLFWLVPALSSLMYGSGNSQVFFLYPYPYLLK